MERIKPLSKENLIPVSHRGTYRSYGTLKSEGDGFKLTLQLARKIPSFSLALDILKKTGAPLRKGETIEKNKSGEIAVFERDFRVMSRHGLVVAFAADSVADFLALSHEDRNDLVTAALLHDATKPVEVAMMGYKKLVDQGKSTEEKKQILEKILSNVDISNVDKIIDQMVNLNPIEFTVFFDNKINEPVLRTMFSNSGLSKEKQARLVSIATSDSMGSLPEIIARARHFGQHLQKDDTMNSFMQFSGKLRHDGKLPHVYGNQKEFLGMILLYCDGITQGTTLATIDQRLDEVVARGAYREVDEAVKPAYDGKTFFEVSRLTAHVIERIIKDEGVKKVKIDVSFIPEELPMLIFDNLESRLRKNI